ncbi:MAG TPA: hypothetical protein VLG37_05470 [Candidatus Saccharimonadales bacterium]|nr:hypothetical protein [Candidatus Saccharimonadales bacterium]
MISKLDFVKNKWFMFGAGILIGALLILTIRFFSYGPAHTHYHANFAVYINGRREEFKSPKYYEEEAACTDESNISTPQERAHMHDQINSVIHVHDHATTWGQFFENLGWVVGPNFIQNADGQLNVATDQAKLHILLNGQDYTDLTPITNMVIKDEDRLLVSYGDESDSNLQAEYKSVPSTAHHYDITKDPASCSGSENVSLKDRFKHLFN